MAQEPSRDGGSDESSRNDLKQITFIDAVRKIVRENVRSPIVNHKQLLLFLQSWWSRHYNRPLKDPLLLSYTMEELLYEYFNYIEQEEFFKEETEQVDDKIEEDRVKANLDWADQEEKKDQEELAKNVSQDKEDNQSQINNEELSEEDKKWMEECVKREIEEGKKIHGDTFGESIDEDFS